MDGSDAAHVNRTLPAFVEWVHFSTDGHVISYAFQEDHRMVLMAHVVMMVLAVTVLLPAALMRRKKLQSLILWTACLVVALIGVGMAHWHKAHTEDMYQNALHRKVGVFLVGVICVGTLRVYYLFFGNQQYRHEMRFEMVPTDIENDSSSRSSTVGKSSGGDGSSTSRNDSFSTIEAHENEDNFSKLDKDDDADRLPSMRFWKLLRQISTTLILVLAYTQCLLGTATYCGLFTDHEIFNGLAHWIKASIFLLYGVWVFMRYLGFGAGVGHAWNSVARQGGTVSAESIECGLIFTYGTIDLFLERLGHADEPISHTDVQHMSIALMFSCAGFIGLLLESRTIQKLLDNATFSSSSSEDASRANKRTCNVLPALVVFFTGLLMSQHAQDSLFNRDLHATWGYYYCVASMFRVLTYCLTYLAPPSRRPTRPPSEVLVSFSLIAGSIVFMMSARDAAQALEYYGIGIMFVVSLSVAGSLAILVWTMYLMILRGMN